MMWYENGNPKSEENWIDGKGEGERTAWYENGNIQDLCETLEYG